MTNFSSSILNFGPIFTPYRVKIDDKYVVCRKNKGGGWFWLATDEVSLIKKTITNFIIIDCIFWCNINLITSSGQSVLLKHFSSYDAEQIKNLIHL